MSRKKKLPLSDAEEKEYLKGEVRKKDKKIKSLEREVNRLTKYLMREEVNYEWNEEELKIKAPAKEKQWKCPGCNSTKKDEITLPQGNIVKKYIICKDCGKKTGKKIDV